MAPAVYSAVPKKPKEYKMEFGIIGLWGSHCSCQGNPLMAQGLLILGSCKAVYWVAQTIYRWNIPWFEGRDITQIEFPLPPMVTQMGELIPVAMTVANCGEAKRCAYCHEEFQHDSACRFCSTCGSATHEECAEINDGCGVFGCLKREGK
jgi:hypothetical protein